MKNNNNNKMRIFYYLLQSQHLLKELLFYFHPLINLIIILRKEKENGAIRTDFLLFNLQTCLYFNIQHNQHIHNYLPQHLNFKVNFSSRIKTQHFLHIPNLLNSLHSHFELIHFYYKY